MAWKIVQIVCVILLCESFCLAQAAPSSPSPKPAVETDLRDNTIKMRSIELERIKRDAYKVQSDRSVEKKKKKKFERTKKLFEKIQKLQDRIILAYTTEAEIDYREISRSASKIAKNASSLEKELFIADLVIHDDSGQKMPRSVRGLIIELDNSLGRFVSSPMFENTKILDKEVSRSAYIDLNRVIKLSRLLSKVAGKF